MSSKFNWIQEWIENKYYVACIDHPELKGNVQKKIKEILDDPYEVI